jgi:thioester reductase-like protein
MNATSRRPRPSAHVLVTGVTGFLGKVVLEELLRRRRELGIARVCVAIRPKGDKTAHERFAEVATSRCFEPLDDGWTDLVRVVSGDLCEARCGLDEADHALLTRDVTHIAHCAASVDFDLPIEVAARSNVRTAMMVLELAKACTRLKSMVSVSTAYVQPHRPGALPVEERLVPLPRPAERIYQSILDGTADAAALMAETGHPNTYTYTKCLTEHLLVQHKGDVPLRIVRPSIISAAWERPMQGWMDSPAAFAGFVLMIGAGYLKNVVGHMTTRLDVVPVDAVADRILDAVFEPHGPAERTPIDIRHAVVGLDRAFSIAQARYGITGFFSAHPVDRSAWMHYIGPRDLRFDLFDALDHRAPTAIAGGLAKLTGNHRQARRVEKLAGRLDYINRAFPYFTSRTFDFASSVPFDEPGFTPAGYVDVVCAGAYRYILGKDERELVIAGRNHKPIQSDLVWATDRRRTDVNETLRALGYGLRKTARRCFDQVTFDEPAFQAALRQVPEDAIPVVVPTHRSYADFLLCSYLFFDRPELGVALPHIAAAEEFGRIRVLGRVLRRSRAFYLSRGRGQRDPELVRQVRALVDQRATLQFFIEGERSRSRRFLAPRRGLLRCLQGTGHRFAILPVALSYERLAEEAVLLRELRGDPKPDMQLRAVLRWAAEMAAGDVRLGRVHASCGTPVLLDPGADVHAVGQQVMRELQAHTVVTDFHLRSFLHQHPEGRPPARRPRRPASRARDAGPRLGPRARPAADPRGRAVHAVPVGTRAVRRPAGAPRGQPAGGRPRAPKPLRGDRRRRRCRGGQRAGRDRGAAGRGLRWDCSCRGAGGVAVGARHRPCAARSPPAPRRGCARAAGRPGRPGAGCRGRARGRARAAGTGQPGGTLPGDGVGDAGAFTRRRVSAPARAGGTPSELHCPDTPPEQPPCAPSS